MYTRGARILVVDDTKKYLDICRKALEGDYDVLLATNGREALALLERYRVDLILMDVHMPELDGFETCRILKGISAYKHIPVIFFTSSDNHEDIATAFSEGAVDYVIKPFHTIEIRERVRIHLELKLSRDELIRQKLELQDEVERRMQEVERTRDSVIRVFANIIETRDPLSANRMNKMQSYARILARELAKEKRYQKKLTQEYIQILYRATPLHDIGKIGVPDRILLKPGSLTQEEFQVIINHTTLGYETLKTAKLDIGGNSALFEMAMDIALYHHERWDGNGYPYGIKGEEIPLPARIVALADAINHKTAGKTGEDSAYMDQVLEELAMESGKKYDPLLVEAMRRTRDLLVREFLEDVPET
ncbi:response regulator [Anaerotalea alkaliphila]|uniref:Stage 0 sporulation protein A homolog n=1 Tax=Anaerotalea alkaliphila TaxID=2662126 RepID=A0A7X5HTA6_9FIRM|nr:HD domain-containing phosphohydrolase [Anaerotalea alkaliphila]NDL66253.1 response regulator [Anaerotalea alkaliphila]